MIKTYIKQSQEIEAIQYKCDIETVKAIKAFGGDTIGPIAQSSSFSGRHLYLDTPEGKRIQVSEGDYILKSNGVVYTRPKNVFEANYREGSLIKSYQLLSILFKSYTDSISRTFVGKDLVLSIKTDQGDCSITIPPEYQQLFDDLH